MKITYTGKQQQHKENKINFSLPESYYKLIKTGTSHLTMNTRPFTPPQNPNRTDKIRDNMALVKIKVMAK